MENKNLFPAVVLMPTNRVQSFVKNVSNLFTRHEALVLGIRCREEAMAIESPSIEKLQQLLAPYPKDAAIKYYLPVRTNEGKAKLCTFTLQFEDEPQLYAVWCQCGKVVSSLSASEIKMLRFAIFENLEAKQICFQSYSLCPDDKWVQLMLNFAHNIQPDEHEWVASEIKFESCEMVCNF